MAHIYKLFKPPRFEDEEKTRQAYLLYVILWTLNIVSILYFIYVLLFAQELMRRVLMQVIFGITINTFLLILVRRGYVRSASIIQVAAFWIFFTATAWTSAGIQHQAYQIGYATVIAIAGLIIGLRGALIIVGISLLSGGLIVITSDMGFWSFKSPDKMLNIWVVSAILFPLLAVLQYLAGKLLRMALAQSQINEAKYRLLADNIKDQVWLMDLNLKPTYINPAVEKTRGFTFEEIVQLPLDKHLTAASLLTAIEFYSTEMPKALTDPTYYSKRPLELEFYCKDGSTLWLETTYSAIRDENGKPLSLLGVGRDTTERRRAEEALRESEEKYRSLFENAVEGFFQTTADGRFLSANPFLAKLLGFSSPQELIETLTNIGEQHYANPQDRVIFKNILESQGNISQYETKLLKKDGTVIWASINARAVRDEKGSILYYEGTLEDITKRKRAENALQVNEQNYRLLASYHKQLNEISIVLAEALDTEDLFKRIAESLRLLTGAIAATFSVYNKDTRILKVVSLSIDPPSSSKAGSIFGPELFEMHMPVSEDVMEHMLIHSIAKPKNLYELTFGVMPKEISDAVMEAAGCRQIVALAICYADELIGTCVAYLPGEQPVVPDDALKTYTHLSGLAIKRKQAEEAYKESEGKLNAIMLSIPDHMSVIDKELNIIWANETAIRLFGSDIIGRKCYEAYHKRKEPCEPYPCLTLKAFKDGGVHEHNTEVVDTVGKTIYFHCTANVALRDKDDKPIAVLETSRDITERKQAEEDLNKSFDKYKELSIMLESLFNSIPDILGIQDAQHGVIRYNQAGYDFLGRTQQEVEGKKCFELINKTKPCDICATSEVYITKKMAQVEKYFEEIGVWLECRSYPVFGEDGKITRIIEHLRDITERKRAEKEKDALQAQLLQAQKIESVGRLAGGVAHDFNNMLNVILGYAQLAMMDIPETEPVYEYLKGIKDSAVRSADLIRKLLAFARKQTIAPIVLELNDTIKGMLTMIKRLIGEDINFAWIPGENLWQVKIDPSQVDQLLANLLVNARDSITDVGKVTIETENTVLDEAYCSVHKGFRPGEYVMLAVSDDGHGMNKDILEHIFEPFFTTKDLGKGTGLGLSTVYGIVKQNEGFINVDSEPGKGSTFKIYLPKITGKATKPKDVSQIEMPKGRGEMILLVEDEASLLNIVRKMLEQLDYKVLTAGTPGEALRKAKDYAAEIQLIITDVIMPEMNGKELAKLISGIKPGLKYLFVSGYTANVIAHHGILEEGVNFIQKPFSMQTLASKVREVLERE